MLRYHARVMDETASFLLAALALTGSPGPNTLSLAAIGAAFGRKRGFRYFLGLNLGMIGVITIVGSGVSGVLLALPGAAPVIAVLAALYFAYLAYRIATAPPLDGDAAPGTEPRWYEGTLLSLVNPKAYAAMAALFSGFTLVAGAPFADTLTKAALVMATLVCVNVGWLTAGAALTHLLRHPRHARIVNIGFAALLVVSVAATFLL